MIAIPILQARIMFDGEYASLQALLNTNTIHVPKPIKVFNTKPRCTIPNHHGPMTTPKVSSGNLARGILEIDMHSIHTVFSLGVFQRAQ